MTSALQDVYMASLSGVEHCQGARPVWFLFPRAKNPTPRETEVCFSVFVGGLFRDFTSARVALLCPNRTHIHCFPARESSQQAPPTTGVPVSTWFGCVRTLELSISEIQNRVARMAVHKSRRQQAGKDCYGCESCICAPSIRCSHLPSFCCIIRLLTTQNKIIV